MGRVAYARIAPNEDLIQGVEKLCLAEGFKNAFVRGALGSLVDACLGTLDGKCLRRKCEEDHNLGYEILKRFAHIMEQRLESTRLQLLDLYGVRS